MSALTPECREELVRFFHNEGDGGIWEDFDRANAEVVADALSPLVARLLAEAWSQGHRTRQRRGADACQYSAWSEGECACGGYGTGELVSLKDNPYWSKS